MPVNHLLPFALPRGRDGTTGRLTVYFSPRLKERARLGRYAAWVDWPATLAGLDPRGPGQRGASPRTPGRRRGLVRRVAGRLRSAYAGRAAPVRRLLRDAAAADGVLGLLRADPGALPRAWPGRTRTARPAGDELRRAGHGRRAGPGARERRANSLAEAAAYRAPMDGRRGRGRARSSRPSSTSTPRSACSATTPSCCGISAWPSTSRCRACRPTRRQVSVSAGFGGGQATRGRPGHPDHRRLPGPAQPGPDHNEQAGGFLRLAAEKAFLSIVDPHLAGVPG